MNEPMEFQRVLVLSTAHIPRWIAEAMNVGIDESPKDARLEPVSFDAVHYGYMVWVPEDDPAGLGIPEELHAPITLAKTHGCQWIRFDEAGPRITGLPTWEW